MGELRKRLTRIERHLYDTRQPQSYVILTTADVLQALDDVLEHGWGQLRIVITEHYIKIVEPTKTWQGQKPPR